MDVTDFQQVLAREQYATKDQTWMPKWWLRFAEFRSLVPGRVRFTRDDVIAFSQSLRDIGVRPGNGGRRCGRLMLTGN